jgi:hypothetical protein
MQECNIILALTQEYRKPPPETVLQEGQISASVKLRSRYVGLVIVPGEHITKIEHEEFRPQQDPSE